MKTLCICFCLIQPRLRQVESAGGTYGQRDHSDFGGKAVGSRLPRSYCIITIPLTLMLIFYALSYSADPYLASSVKSSDIKLKLLFSYDHPLKHVQPCFPICLNTAARYLSFVQSKVIKQSL